MCLALGFTGHLLRITSELGSLAGGLAVDDVLAGLLDLATDRSCSTKLVTLSFDLHLRGYDEGDCLPPMLMPSTSLSETARSTCLTASFAVSVAVFCRMMLELKAARGTVETAKVRGTVARRRTAVSVRKDMVIYGCR